MDWIGFLNERNIEHATSGHGIAGSNVAIQPCPFCGSFGRPFHLHISLEGRGWRCWRTDHKGGDAALIQKLLGCSWQEANAIAGTVRSLANDFALQISNILKPTAVNNNKSILRLPEEFKPLSTKPSCRPYVKYLDTRGFTNLKLLTDRFGLHYCTQGAFHSRIIFPIYLEGKLVSWTGRAIYKKAELRYKTLSHKPKPGLPTAPLPIQHCLLWYDDLFKWFANTFILVEGPFDALKINYLGRKLGIVSTCFFKNNPSDYQIDLLRELLPLFKHRHIMMDKESEILTTLKVGTKLRALGLKPMDEFGALSTLLPPGLKDPGGLEGERSLRKLLQFSQN
jgi:hypothetical protein